MAKQGLGEARALTAAGIAPRQDPSQLASVRSLQHPPSNPVILITMRLQKRYLWLLALLMVPGLLAARSDAAGEEEEAIRATIGHYFRGDIERDVEQLKLAFHPTAVLQSSGESGALGVLRQPEWHERVRLTPERERPNARILQIDRTGNAAMAKTQLVFTNGQFTDYLSLLKLEGRWVIVNKTYQWEEK